jgi:oligoribonuclease NrnB/cAMP/cGMP phosphodiesterase (DHH superfamily)
MNKERLKNKLEFLNWKLKILEIDNKKEFNRLFVDRKEFDQVLFELEQANAELKKLRAENSQLLHERNYLRKKVMFLKQLLKESYEMINFLEQKIAKAEIKTIEKISKFFKTEAKRCQTSTSINKKEQIDEETSIKRKSHLRQLIEKTLKRKFDIKSKQSDIESSKENFSLKC